jgi:hypothetical protein
MSLSDGQLPIPGAAIADAKSFEMIRAWIANNGLHCSLNIGVWESRPGVEEPRAWGILIADVARHVADALTRQGKERIKTVAEIRDSFLAEIGDPSSGTSGEFVDEPSLN